MTTINSYKYKNSIGVVISPKKPEGECEEMKRLIADDGKILVNGETTATVIDVMPEEVENWEEVDEAAEAPDEEEQLPEDEEPTPGSETATEADYIEALTELGVRFDE